MVIFLCHTFIFVQDIDLLPHISVLFILQSKISAFISASKFIYHFIFFLHVISFHWFYCPWVICANIRKGKK